MQTDKPAYTPQAEAPANDPQLIAAQSDDWARLVTGVRRGSPEAGEEFVNTYSRGAKVFFKRNLGPVGLDLLVDQALQGALAEIRAGLIEYPFDLVAFFRHVLKQHTGFQPGEDQTGRFESGTATVLGSTDKARIRGKIARLESLLRDCSQKERSVLERYFIHGHPLEMILQEMGMDRTHFEKIKTTLLTSVSKAGLRRPPSAHTQMFKRRAAVNGF
ncbi:MAG: hypothetical protein FJW20_08290 [Acidimicrobiia bacterium]|nr:hypothetical protein [Acidimicrobiia bacterium]